MAWTTLMGNPIPDSPRPSSRHGRTDGTSSIGDTSIPLGTTQPCPKCGEIQERCATPPNATGHQLYYWSSCTCVSSGQALQAAIVAAAKARQNARDDALLGNPGLTRIAGKTLDTFNPHLLARSEDGTHPYNVLTTWLTSLDDPQSNPAPALYCHSPVRGCGKTHLAAAMLHTARAHGRRVAFVEELSYLSLAWNLPFGPDREQMIALPAEQAWLAIFDDIGRYEPGKSRAGVQNAWNDLISRRYTVRDKYSIFTSNYTPDELKQRGTIDEAAYSRLCEMTRMRLIAFHGKDQRRVQR